MILELEVREGVIQRAAFQTYGCPAAIACGSMTTMLIQGRPLDSALNLEAKDLVRLLGGLPEGKEHCAPLAVKAIREAILSGQGVKEHRT